MPRGVGELEWKASIASLHGFPAVVCVFELGNHSVPFYPKAKSLQCSQWPSLRHWGSYLYADTPSLQRPLPSSTVQWLELKCTLMYCKLNHKCTDTRLPMQVWLIKCCHINSAAVGKPWNICCNLNTKSVKYRRQPGITMASHAPGVLC